MPGQTLVWDHEVHGTDDGSGADPRSRTGSEPDDPNRTPTATRQVVSASIDDDPAGEAFDRRHRQSHHGLRWRQAREKGPSPTLWWPSLFQKVHDLPCKQIFVERLAFPDDQDLPTLGFELALHGGIALDVASELLLPEIVPRLRSGRPLAAGMAVPKAAMHEHDLASSRKDEIRMSSHPLHVQSVSIPEPMRGAAHEHLRLGVLAAYARHQRRSRRFDGGITQGEVFLGRHASSLSPSRLLRRIWCVEKRSAGEEKTQRPLDGEVARQAQSASGRLSRNLR